MKKLIILRGLPGSGKTRAVNSLPDLPIAVVCSADHFFMHDGEYKFDLSRLGEAHAQCQRLALNAMARSLPLVIIDNTNVRLWEWALYAQMGEVFGYKVEVQTIGGHSMDDVRTYAARNVHGVPELEILKMAYRWEE